MDTMRPEMKYWLAGLMIAALPLAEAHGWPSRAVAGNNAQQAEAASNTTATRFVVPSPAAARPAQVHTNSIRYDVTRYNQERRNIRVLDEVARPPAIPPYRNN
ncbi:hypothetical protein [Paraburkholderia hayleyella]|uniref:hypothetical protein n=1 Tax=Paraburkholderia hayleyella TaxID=2152889 RepID=UPI00129204AE|nr:hypothetical protein [Paraburkholderia hayleyella]